MSRIHMLLCLAAPFLFGGPAAALPRETRGSLVFDNIPEPAPELTGRLTPI